MKEHTITKVLPKRSNPKLLKPLDPTANLLEILKTKYVISKKQICRKVL